MAYTFVVAQRCALVRSLGRRVFCALMGALLLGVCAQSNAETIPATLLSNQMPARDFTTFGYPANGSSGGYDPQAACESIFRAFYGTIYSGIKFLKITEPRTVSCQAARWYDEPSTFVQTFNHLWSCPGVPGWQHVDVPEPICKKYVCPEHQNWTLTGNQCVRPDPLFRISLDGASRTKALPAGPALPYTAKVSLNGNTAAGRSVTVSTRLGASIAGTTDAAGEFRFLYVPPALQAAEDELLGVCSGCSNTARVPITIEPCEICGGSQ
jgi:hypothetical protein